MAEALQTLRRALIEAAGADTAYPPLAHLWQPGTLNEHCGAVAYVVQQRYGGQILSGRDSSGIRHLWNRLPDGREVSLVYPDLQPPAKGRVVPRTTTSPRFRRFLARVTR